MFKIRHPNGTYSSGGMTVTFSRTGKTWRGLGPLQSHIGQLNSSQLEIYNGCVVETYELIRYENPAIGLTVSSPKDWYENKEFIKKVFSAERNKRKNNAE